MSTPISRKRRRHWRRQLKRNPKSGRGIYSTLKLLTKLGQGRRYRPKLDLDAIFEMAYAIARRNKSRAAHGADCDCSACCPN